MIFQKEPFELTDLPEPQKLPERPNLIFWETENRIYYKFGNKAYSEPKRLPECREHREGREIKNNLILIIPIGLGMTLLLFIITTFLK